MVAAVRTAIEDLFDNPRINIQAYKNKASILPTTALMISNSFGDASAPIFAGAFRELLHISANDMKNGKLAELLRRVAIVKKIDRIIMLVEEGNTDRIVVWSESLATQCLLLLLGNTFRAQPLARGQYSKAILISEREMQ